jgi:hypothetical protein
MLKRLYDHLTALARRHAPHLLSQLPPEQAIKPLATGLAREGILVLVGQPMGQEQSEVMANINSWVGLYGRMYEILVEDLFPRHTRIQAQYMDHLVPPIIAFEGEADHVVRVIAGYVIPYMAVRQGERLISDAELDGLMRHVLADLDDHLNPQIADRIRRAGVLILHDLLRANVKQIALTDFIKPIFQGLPPTELPKFETIKAEPPAPPPSVPEPPSVPVPPTLPEAPPKKMDTQVMFASKIPIFFKKPEKTGDKDKRPPLPPPGPKTK